MMFPASGPHYPVTLQRSSAAAASKLLRQVSPKSINTSRELLLHVGGELDNFAQPSPPLARPGGVVLSVDRCSANK